MKSKKKVASAMLAAILIGLMSFSVYAATEYNATGSASASASGASASAESDVAGHINLSAVISNALDSARQEFSKSKVTSGSVAVSASSLSINGGDVQSARAYSSFNSKCLAEKYWSKYAR